VIWSAGMRVRLTSQLDRQLSEAPPAAAVHLAELAKWRYEELSDELVVRDVYVRLLVEVRRFIVPCLPSFVPSLLSFPSLS
jgi:hypothetical protein